MRPISSALSRRATKASSCSSACLHKTHQNGEFVCLYFLGNSPKPCPLKLADVRRSRTHSNRAAEDVDRSPNLANPVMLNGLGLNSGAIDTYTFSDEIRGELDANWQNR